MTRNIMSRYGKNTAYLVVTLIVIYILITSIRIKNVGGSSALWLEAEATVNIESPMEIIDDENASGGKCLEIKQGMGTGMLGAGGKATYEIDIPDQGQYAIWVRVYWLDGCSNSFFIELGGKIYHFGEDSAFNQWHWIKILTQQYTKSGKEFMVISNREDGIKIDKFLLTTDLEYVPQGFGGGLRHFDFSDNTLKDWKPKDKSRWSIKDSYGMDKSPAYYVSSSTRMDIEYSIINIYTDNDFIFQSLARSTQYDKEKRNFLLFYDFINRTNFKYVDYNDTKISIKKVINGKEHTVAESEESINHKCHIDDNFHFLQLKRNGKTLSVYYDGIPAVLVEEDFWKNGKIGLGSNYGAVIFDDVVYAIKSDINYSQNFYYDQEAPAEDVKGWYPQGGQWIRSTSRGMLSYEVEAEGVAASLSGRQIWNNYKFEVAEKADGESGVGIIWYALNSNNFYLFRWCGVKSSKVYANKKQLIRILNGNVTVLAEKEGGYIKDQWYRLKSEHYNGRIKTFIDDELIFDVVDRNLFQGKVGLWIDGRSSASASYSRMKLWPGTYYGDNWRQQFTFQVDKEDITQGIYFCYQDSLNYYLLKWGGMKGMAAAGMLHLVEVLNGKEKLIEQKKNFMEFSKTYSTILSKEGNTVILRIGEPKQDETGSVTTYERMRFEINESVLSGGKIGFDSGRTSNAVFDDISVCSIQGFYDDFSIYNNTIPLYWAQKEGNWIVVENELRSSPNVHSTVIAGDDVWSNYCYDITFISKTNDYGTNGIYFYYIDENNWYMYKCISSDDMYEKQLLKNTNGCETLLDVKKDFYKPHEVMNVSVELDQGWICVYEDKIPILHAYDLDITNGKIGIYSDGQGDVSFDNVQISFDKKYYTLERVNSVFASKNDGLAQQNIFDGWLDADKKWKINDGMLMNGNEKGKAELIHCENDFFGDITLVLDVASINEDSSGIQINLINSNKKKYEGYNFNFTSDGIQVFKCDSLMIDQDEPKFYSQKLYHLKFEKRREHLLGFINDKCVFCRCDDNQLEGGKISLVALNGRICIDNIKVYTYPIYYYDFNLARWAATDLSHWRVGSGRWDELYLIYGIFGEKNSNKDAFIWHKEKLTRKIAIDMKYFPLFYSNTGEFVVTINGDGKDGYSGYSAHIKYEIIQESDYSISYNQNVFLKKGDVVLAQGTKNLFKTSGWVKMRLENNDGKLKLFIGDELILSYTDKRVPAGNMMALGVLGNRYRPMYFQDIAIYSIQ